MIGIYLGQQDSGKTLSMTFQAYKYFKNGYNIYSNYNLKFKHEKISKELLKAYVSQKIQFNKSVFVIDEIYLIFDSRSSIRKFNKVFSYFVLQTSKRDVHLLGTAQYFNTIDKRFRESISFICHCNRCLNIDNKFRDINIGKRLLKNNENLYIKNTFFVREQETFLKQIYYLKAEPIFKLYDTRELLGFDDD